MQSFGDAFAWPPDPMLLAPTPRPSVDTFGHIRGGWGLNPSPFAFAFVAQSHRWNFRRQLNYALLFGEEARKDRTKERMYPWGCEIHPFLIGTKGDNAGAGKVSRQWRHENLGRG